MSAVSMNFKKYIILFLITVLTSTFTGNTNVVNATTIKPLINVLPLKGSSQAIIIKVPKTTSVTGTCYVYNKNSNGNWVLLWQFSCVIGMHGVSTNRTEGDGTTPAGIYGFLYEFGWASNPGTKYKYVRTKKGDYWSSVRTFAEYNTFVHYDGNPLTHFGSKKYYEDLYATTLYKYAAVIAYNTGVNKVVGKGSGIFMHIERTSYTGTSGCIGLKVDNLLKILKWMDPAKSPKICIGTESYLRGLK